MTLLESIIALVILALSAVGALEVFQSANRSAASASDWIVAASYAEQGVEAAKIGEPESVSSVQLANGYLRTIASKPSQHGLTDVAVTVVLPGGAEFVVHRLVQPR